MQILARRDRLVCYLYAETITICKTISYLSIQFRKLTVLFIFVNFCKSSVTDSSSFKARCATFDFRRCGLEKLDCCMERRSALQSCKNPTASPIFLSIVSTSLPSGMHNRGPYWLSLASRAKYFLPIAYFSKRSIIALRIEYDQGTL